METRLIRTDDGSYTLFVPSLNEHYHSTFGAVRESLHIFIGAGLMACDHEAKTLSIFEVGFGTGLNAYLTLLESAKFVPAVHYTAIESDPVDITLISTLNYPELCGDKDAARYTGLHDTPGIVKSRLKSFSFFIKFTERSGSVNFRPMNMTWSTLMPSVPMCSRNSGRLRSLQNCLTR